MFVLLALADIDIVFTLCRKASLTDLWEWADYTLIPDCFALPKAFTQIKLKILLFFISPNEGTHSFSHTSRLPWTLGNGFCLFTFELQPDLWIIPP